MSLYNPSEFLQVIKEDMGVKDIVLPVSDAKLYQRFLKSSLPEFSVRAPYVKTIHIDSNNFIHEGAHTPNGTEYLYQIPKEEYLGYTLLGVCRVDTSHPNGYMDAYVPNGMQLDPYDAIAFMSEISLMATSARSMGRAPTRKFVKPDKLFIWNAWAGGSYEVDILLCHDPALTTVSDTAFTNLRELATYDLESYMYNLLKRKDHLDVGVGSFDLKIDEWQDAGNRFRELLKEWDISANIDYDSINFY